MLLDQLPPESRTKTWQRDQMDPVQLAALAGQDTGRGWGPHSRTDELLCLIGESIDRVSWHLVKVNGANPDQPDRWRRPGVLGRVDLVQLELEQSADNRADLETERAERARRREQLRQQQAQQEGSAPS